jgi:uncharacterized protein (TIGR02266 family)
MWVEESSGQGCYFQRSANLSAGGIFLEKTIPHPIGTVVQLEFTLPGDDQPIKVAAEIVNALARPRQPQEGSGDALGMGLKFLALETSQAERIERLIASRSG